ncbi:MAG: GNAT family N-acetyltransferase [Chloroflexota bacterium]
MAADNRPFMTPFLTGKRVYLRPFEAEDLWTVQKWYNDRDLRGECGVTTPYSRFAAERWLSRMNEDRERVWFAVCLVENDRVIGEAGLLRMFPTWRQTDATLIIGEKDAQGKGYGSEAIGLLLDYAFGYQNMHRVAIGVVGFNERAQKFWEKAGFRREGVWRESYFWDHKYHDFVMMSILEDEYRAMYRNGERIDGAAR